MVTFNLIFRIIEGYAPLIPILFFFIRKSRRLIPTNLLISYLIIYFALVYIANNVLVKNNIIAYIILSALTFCFFSLMLESFLFQTKFKFFNRTVMIITVLFFIVNAIWLEGTTLFNSYSSGLSNLILVAYCVYYYKLQLEKPQIIFVERQPSFWIVSGIFIYSAGNTFLFSIYSSLTRSDPDFAYYAWGINVILILIMNIFFAKGIQCNWRK